MPDSWVINASSVILLAKVGLIELVPQLGIELVIPSPVRDEVCCGPADDPGAGWLRAAGSAFLKPPEPEPSGFADLDLGPGERSVLAWALARPGFIAVLDDLAARNEALRRGLPLLGTVGVVLRLKRAGLIVAARLPLERIRQVGGHISAGVFQEALQRAGET